MYWYFINCSHLTSYIFAFALTNIDALCLFLSACTAVFPSGYKEIHTDRQTDRHMLNIRMRNLAHKVA